MCRTGGYTMVRRRSIGTKIGTKIGNHTFRATGITAYLNNGGTLENAAAIANHASTRSTQLYDRRHDEIGLDEVERTRVWSELGGSSYLLGDRWLICSELVRAYTT